MQMPTLENDIVTEDGKPGWMGYFHSHESDDSMTALEKPTVTRHIDETRIFLRCVFTVAKCEFLITDSIARTALTSQRNSRSVSHSASVGL